MLKKRLEFGGEFYNTGERRVQLLESPQQLIKVASERDPELQVFLDDYNCPKDHFALLVLAVSAGEIWGSNNNGDYFLERELLTHYKRFLDNGHVYKHHVNKDPSKKSGDIVFAYYNKKMHRVELVVEMPIAANQEVHSKAVNNIPIPVSMGCKVPSDTCSICGHIRKKYEDKCSHWATIGLNKILPTGEKFYLINNPPYKFFDISIVLCPADKVGYTLEKVAFDGMGKDDEDIIGSDEFYKLEEDVSSLSKYSELAKEIGGVASDIKADLKHGYGVGLKNIFPDKDRLSSLRLPKIVIIRLSNHKIGDTLGVCARHKVGISPMEIIKILLNKNRMQKETEYTEDTIMPHFSSIMGRLSRSPNVLFKVASSSLFNESDDKIDQQILSILEGRVSGPEELIKQAYRAPLSIIGNYNYRDPNTNQPFHIRGIDAAQAKRSRNRRAAIKTGLVGVAMFGAHMLGGRKLPGAARKASKYAATAGTVGIGARNFLTKKDRVRTQEGNLVPKHAKWNFGESPLQKTASDDLNEALMLSLDLSTKKQVEDKSEVSYNSLDGFINHLMEEITV